MISPSQKPLPKQHTTNTTVGHPCRQRHSNARSQQSSGCKTTPDRTATRIDYVFILIQNLNFHYYLVYLGLSPSQWRCGLRRGFTAVRLLRLRVRFPPGHGRFSLVSGDCQVEVSATGRSLVQRSPMDVCCECCVLSGRGLCDGPITRPEESYGCLSVVSVVCCQVEVCATG